MGVKRTGRVQSTIRSRMTSYSNHVLEYSSVHGRTWKTFYAKRINLNLVYCSTRVLFKISYLLVLLFPSGDRRFLMLKFLKHIWRTKFRTTVDKCTAVQFAGCTVLSAGIRRLNLVYLVRPYYGCGSMLNLVVLVVKFSTVDLLFRIVYLLVRP